MTKFQPHIRHVAKLPTEPWLRNETGPHLKARTSTQFAADPQPIKEKMRIVDLLTCPLSPPKPSTGHRCHHCNRIFRRKHDLNRHVRIHADTRPYLCTRCGKAFVRSDALRRHEMMTPAQQRFRCVRKSPEETRRNNLVGQIQSTAPRQLRDLNSFTSNLSR